MKEILEKELKASFDYFWHETNDDVNSLGYGVTRDSTEPTLKDFGSVAAVGFALSAYVVGISKQYITYDQGYQRALGTLKTFFHQAEHTHGFFYHFIRLEDARRFGKSEVSIIDTALFLAGAIVAAEYFSGEVAAYFEKIFKRIEWDWYLCDQTNHFYMGYFEEEGGFTQAQWNHYAEQFLMYILGIGTDFHPVDPSVFYAFEHYPCKYGEHEYIRSGPNSLFVYQFSHGFIDLRGTRDRNGVDWFQNSVSATLAHRQFCIDHADQYKTYSENSWGLSACHFKHGYTGGFGAEPCGDGVDLPNNINDGTVAPYSVFGSLVFAPEVCLQAIDHFASIENLWGKYGFKESYNLDEDPPYVDDLFLGIDKGITLVQIANYENELIWKIFMKNKYVQQGMQRIGIQAVDTVTDHAE